MNVKPGILRYSHFALLGFFSSLFFLNNNILNYPEASVGRVLVFTLIVSAVISVVFLFRFKSADQPALIALCLSAFFFGFSHAANVSAPYFNLMFWIEQGLWVLSLFLVYLLGVFAWITLTIIRKGIQGTALHAPISAALLFLSLIQGGQLAFSSFTKNHTVGPQQEAALVPQKTFDQSRPNLYVIVLDAYARADVLQGLYHYDNQWFLDGLRQKGFQIGELSTSNYFLSAQSMSSMFDLDYIQDKVSHIEADTEDLMPFNEILNHPRSRKKLSALGYTYVASSVLFPPLEATGADVYVSNTFDHLSAYDSFLETTALRLFLQNHDKYRRFVLGNLHSAAPLGVKHTPAWIYLHITLPHPPFVFDAKGNPVGNHHRLTFQDGVKLIGHGVDHDEYKRAYTQQVEFVSHEALKVMADILDQDKSDPYIILMSDHGPRLFHENKAEDPDELLAACANLLAVRVPGGEKAPEEALTCPLNLMRYVISRTTAEPFIPVPSRIFLTHADSAYAFKEITEQIKNRIYSATPHVSGQTERNQMLSSP